MDTYENFKIGVKWNYFYEEIINSDKDIYGGSNKINPKKIRVYKKEWQRQTHSINITVPPLGIVLLKPVVRPKRTKKAK